MDGERSQVPATERAIEMALTAAQAAADKKAQDIVVLDVADQLVITDAFLLASAPNERQVLAISDAIQESLLGQAEVKADDLRFDLLHEIAHDAVKWGACRSRNGAVWVKPPFDVVCL